MRRLLAVSILATTAADPVLVHANGNCLDGVSLSMDKVSLADCESLSLAAGRSYFQFPVNETDSGYCTGCPDDPSKFRLDARARRRREPKTQRRVPRRHSSGEKGTPCGRGRLDEKARQREQWFS